MVDRVTLLKLKKEHAGPAERSAIARHALEVLRSLPGVVAVQVGLPADDASAASWDLNVTVRLASRSDLEAYRADPVQRRFTEEFLAARSEVTKAWSFEVESA